MTTLIDVRTLAPAPQTFGSDGLRSDVHGDGGSGNPEAWNGPYRSYRTGRDTLRISDGNGGASGADSDGTRHAFQSAAPGRDFAKWKLLVAMGLIPAPKPAPVEEPAPAVYGEPLATMTLEGTTETAASADELVGLRKTLEHTEHLLRIAVGQLGVLSTDLDEADQALLRAKQELRVARLEIAMLKVRDEG